MPMTQAVLDTAAAHPHRVAIAGPEAVLTYGDLVPDSARLFAAVQELHAAQSQPPAPAPEADGIPLTAMSVDSAFQTARFVVGLSGFRAVSATIDPRWPLEHRVGVILHTGIGVVITDTPDLEPALAARGWTGTVVSLDAFTARIDALVAESETGQTAAGQQALAQPAVRDGAEPFLLLFSSGTTSNPKAFLKTRQQYRANAAISTAHLEPLPGVVTLAPGPVSYSLTLYAVVECMVTGGSVHVADSFDPLALARRIEAESVTRIVAVPAVVKALTEAARRDPAPLRGLELIVTGGANLPASIRDGLTAILPDVRLISYYGAAEIGFIGDSRAGDGTRIRIYDGVRAAIRDTAGAPVPNGELGTLWILAEACSHGYLGATTDAQLVEPDGWATVHDQGRIVDGQLELVGRAGDITVTGGHTVALTEVERAFDGFPGIESACAVSLPDATLGTVVALVVEEAGVVADSTNLKSRLRDQAAAHLAPQYVPRRWYRIDTLPRTVGGKIRREATADQVRAGQAERL